MPNFAYLLSHKNRIMYPKVLDLCDQISFFTSIALFCLRNKTLIIPTSEESIGNLLQPTL